MISTAQKAHIRPVHPFPARMAPSLIFDALPKTGKPITVLDPMSGSGTTLVSARSLGHRAIGFDTDPLAHLIALAWCADNERDALLSRAKLVLGRARNLARSHGFASHPYPTHDDETNRFIDFWFDQDNRRDLGALAACISRVRSSTERILLWCAFSRMIITKTSGVSLAMDVSHSRPHKVYAVAPVKPFDVFLSSVTRVSNALPFADGTSTAPPAEIYLGDARSLALEDESVDMVITSPPYLNAIDYLRGHKLTLVWMGHSIPEIRALRSDNIGTEVTRGSTPDSEVQKIMNIMADLDSLDERRSGMLHRYVLDMRAVIEESSRVLKPKGGAIFVVGDSAIRGVFVKNSEAIMQLANQMGLSLVSHDVRPIEAGRRYLPPPESRGAGSKMQGRMREEVVLEFRKA